MGGTGHRPDEAREQNASTDCTANSRKATGHGQMSRVTGAHKTAIRVVVLLAQPRRRDCRDQREVSQVAASTGPTRVHMLHVACWGQEVSKSPCSLVEI
jgi:hypothetical protein